jgi:hypothetical protein
MHPMPFFILFAIMASCVSAQPPKADDPNNIIVLLDLSDRLLVKDQIQRDKEILKASYSIFEKKVRKSFYINSKNLFMVRIAFQKRSPLYYEDINKYFYINMGSILPALRHKEEADRRQKFMSALDSLYVRAVFSTKRNDYCGADIARYFRDDLPNDITQGAGKRTYLVIVTDGYMFIEGKQHEMADKWIPVNKKFDNCNAIVMEIGLKDMADEYDRLKEIWTQWLNEMGITNVFFTKKDMINKDIESLNKFIPF